MHWPGILLTFRLSTAESNNGIDLVLPVIAVVLLGGVSIFGGKGSIVGVVLAVLVYCGLQSALLLTNFNANALELVTGGLAPLERADTQRRRAGGPCPPLLPVTRYRIRRKEVSNRFPFDRYETSF